MRKYNCPFVVTEDKVDEFLQEAFDEKVINRIYERAGIFEKKIKETIKMCNFSTTDGLEVGDDTK